MAAWPELKDKVVLITGGSTGIGYEVACDIAANGGQPWICGRSLSRIDAATAEAAGKGLTIHGRRANVNDPQAVAALVDEITRSSGRLDGLVCAAGSGVLTTIDDMTLEDWERTVSDMMRGVFLPVHKAVPAMKATGSGSIVVTSSVHAHANTTHRDGIAAATAGLNGFCRGVAVSMARYDIRINSVSPGPVETPTWRKNWTSQFPEMDFSEIAGKVGKSIPLGRIAQPNEVADPILFLLSDRSRYITGANLAIDGGLTAKLAMDTRLD